MKPRAYGTAAIVAALAELVLCFVGPLAFLRKPSLVLFPVFSYGIDQAETARLTEYLERSIARTGSFSIVSQQFIADYFARTDPQFDRSTLEPVNYEDALRISRELELERLAIALLFRSPSQSELSITIRDVRDGEILRSGRFTTDTFDNLLADVDAHGKKLALEETLKVDTRGMGLTDWLVLALLALQLGVGIVALTGREPGLLVEVALVPTLILFLFAYIYALSANMDYVQRFIASAGQLRLARSTAAEQLHAAIRFGPMLILGAAHYVMRRRGPAPAAPPVPAGALRPFAARWALPAVMLSALMFSLAFPSALALDGMGWLAWVALLPLFLVLMSSSPGKAVFYGVAFGAIQALVINYWHGTYRYVTLHVIIVVLVAQYLLFMVVLVGLIKLSGRWGFIPATLAWVGFDFLRSVGILGYPWGVIGTSQYRVLPLIQIASVAGVWGVDAVVVLANACLAWALDGWAAGPARRRRAIVPLATGAAVLAASLVAGALILGGLDARLRNDPGLRTATVVLVQQNTDPRKHEYQDHLNRLTGLTDAALAALPSPPDLVVWPEGGFPVDIRYSQRPDMANTDWAALTEGFLAYQARIGVWLVTGEQDHVALSSESGEETIRNFNSSVLVDPQGRICGFYHKRHLVPFTEYFPLDKQRFGALYELFQKFDISNWEVGADRLIYEHPKMRFFTPICFEDLFSDEMRLFVREGADLIANMSNDYWSLSPVEGRQHGLIALFRAVENQRPLVRATVSGYTVAVDAAGRILPGAPAPYTEGYTVARLTIPQARLTFYTRYGDWFPRLCLLAAAAWILASGGRRLARRVLRARAR